MIKIYQIDFADGTQYVGQTCRSIKRRIQHHISCPANSAVTERLLSGKYEVKVLSRHRLQGMANKAELSAIRRLTKPLNFHGVAARMPNGLPELHRPMPRAGRWRERTTKDARCSVCRQTKPAINFYTDRSRFNGLESRCKLCSNALKRAVTRARRHGNDVSAAYAAAKAALQPFGDTRS